MNNFDDVLAKSFFEMMEKCYDSLEKDSWQSFCTELRDGLNNIGLRIMKQMLEQVNLAFKDDQSLSPEWVVERNGDLKSILTVFGILLLETISTLLITGTAFKLTKQLTVNRLVAAQKAM